MADKQHTTLHATITIDPKDKSAFFEAFKPAYRAVIAEECNSFFEVVEDPEVPGQFHFWEGWTKGVEWLMAVSDVAHPLCIHDNL